jgi:hypothetical protein
MWIDVYNAVTTEAGRYVQGGGCTTVGVADSSKRGFGSFSKNYGTCRRGLLEAEIVTADGAVRTANPCASPDLFWPLKVAAVQHGRCHEGHAMTRELPAFWRSQRNDQGYFGCGLSPAGCPVHSFTATAS